MNAGFERMLRDQAGVISRQQALAIGMYPHDIRKMLRRKEWAPVHHGVYVAHTGPLTWPQRAWAGVLYAAPAALCLESALRAAESPGQHPRDEQAVIQVAVCLRRATLTEPHGVRIYRLAHLEDRVLWNVGPPRLKYDEAALDVACRAASELDAIAVLANACQSRRTTARRLLESLDCRQRIRGRRWLRAVLLDIADGTCSVLEHGYLDRVERPHGLPKATRQQRCATSVGVCYRDTEYAGRLVIELDGRIYHDSAAARDADFERDLDAAVDGRATVRLSYGQVFGRACQTAAKITRILQLHGIAVDGHPCGRGCEVAWLRRAA